jgi:hypothetical protein
MVSISLAANTARADIDLGVPAVALGSDYFATQGGTFFDFGPGIGPVPFMGLPIGPGNTDTIVQRQADAAIGGAAIPIQITALSLKSVAPVNVGGSFFDVFVTLDPAHLANDTGTMSIMGTLAGGTFTSSLNVFFDAHFQPVGAGSPFDVFSNVTLANAGATWGPTPPPGIVIVNGPDDNTAADQNANMHSGRGTGEVDFFLVGQGANGSGGRLVETGVTGNEAHIVGTALPFIPEPSSLTLAGLGVTFLFGYTWRKRRAAAA